MKINVLIVHTSSDVLYSEDWTFLTSGSVEHLIVLSTSMKCKETIQTLHLVT